MKEPTIKPPIVNEGSESAEEMELEPNTEQSI